METCCRNSFKVFMRICIPQKPLPSVNHMQTDQSHQKSQPLRRDKKPNFSRGQPMLWKCQKLVVRQTQARFSLFNPSIAGLQMGKTWAQCQGTSPSADALKSSISSFGQIFSCPSPEFTGHPANSNQWNQWKLCSKDWAESALDSRCFTFFSLLLKTKCLFNTKSNTPYFCSSPKPSHVHVSLN